MEEVIKSYKGFNRDMTCNPDGASFQYEEGKEYEEDNAEACECGFHACEMPLDVFSYYPPGTSVYHEVEQSGKISRKEDGSKVASTKIKIGARLDIAGLAKAQIEYVKKRTNNEHTDPEHATAGDRGAATAGDSGAATAGDRGAATAGDRGAATAGYFGAATSRGTSEVGKNGLAVARGKNVKVKGGIGSILVIAEENADDYDIADWKAVIVDGENVKADTWYCLKDGELCEVAE